MEDSLYEEDVYPWRRCIRDGKAKGLRPSQARKRCGYIKHHGRNKHEDCECEILPHSFEEECPVCIEELISEMKTEEVYPCDQCSTVLFSERDLARHKNFAHTTYGMGLSGGELIDTTDKNYEEGESLPHTCDENCGCDCRGDSCTCDCFCQPKELSEEEIGRFGRNKKPFIPPQDTKIKSRTNYPENYNLDISSPDIPVPENVLVDENLSDDTKYDPKYRQRTMNVNDPNYNKMPIVPKETCPKCGQEIGNQNDLERHLRYSHATDYSNVIKEKKRSYLEEKKLPPVPFQDDVDKPLLELEKFPDKKYRPKRPEWTCELCGYPARSHKWYRHHMKQAHQIEKKELDELSPENEYGPEIDVSQPDYDRQHTPKDKKHRKEESSISLDVNDNLGHCSTCSGEGKLTLDELEEVSKVACPDCQGTGLDYMQNVDDAFEGGN